jgi:hypothetical protein
VTLLGHIPADERNGCFDRRFDFPCGRVWRQFEKKVISLRHWTYDNGSYIFHLICIMLDVGPE